MTEITDLWKLTITEAASLIQSKQISPVDLIKSHLERIENTEKQLHYINLDAGFTKGANRFSIGYGKKREGIFCVGGICKFVPSSNGFSLNISSSF